MHYFPDANHVGPFGPAFLRLMFANAALERRVADLQDVVTGKAGFGEQNQWGARERPKRMITLIRQNSDRVVIAPDDVHRIVDLLKRAIPHCETRNLLAHGHWWALAPDAKFITIRRWKLRSGQTQHMDVTPLVTWASTIRRQR